MAKHNYSQYSNKNRNNNDHKPEHKTESKPQVVTANNVMAAEQIEKPVTPIISKLAQETVETVALPETVEGRLINCVKLNVRENATVDSDIVCVLDTMSEFEIDVNKSTDKWFYVYAASGAEGYCMRQYIEAHM